jgi:ribonuclease R
LGKDKGKRESRHLLQQAEKLTLALRQVSQKQGRLDLDMPELSVERGEGFAAPVHIRLQTTLRSHRIIEDAMLAANRSAAQLLKEKRVGALFRVHEKPDYDKIFTLQQELHFFGIKWEVDPQDPQESLAELVRMIRGHQLEGLLQFLILRSMKQAQYANDPRIGHFGLGFADYLHFTSPIRRYPDLVVHRQIRNLLAGKGSFYSEERLEQLGQHCSMTERLSMMAERDMLKLAVCRYFAGKEGEVYRAMVSGVSRFGLYVTLMETPVEGRLLFENIHGDYYVYLDNERAAYGRRTGHRVKMGSVLEVELLSVDWAEANVDFTFDPLVHEQKTPKKGDNSWGKPRRKS